MLSDIIFWNYYKRLVGELHAFRKTQQHSSRWLAVAQQGARAARSLSG
jgi:hypothetical protein